MLQRCQLAAKGVFGETSLHLMSHYLDENVILYFFQENTHDSKSVTTKRQRNPVELAYDQYGQSTNLLNRSLTILRKHNGELLYI